MNIYEDYGYEKEQKNTVAFKPRFHRILFRYNRGLQQIFSF